MYICIIYKLSTIFQLVLISFIMERTLNTDPKLYSKEWRGTFCPEIVGFFSVDGEQRYVPGASRLRYMTATPGRVWMDLTKAEELAISRDENNEMGNHPFFHYLKAHSDQLDEIADEGDPRKAGIVTNRSTLKNLGKLIYEDRHSMSFSVKFINGVIYLFKMTNRQEILNNRSTRPTHWGYKFEDYMCSKTPFEKSDTSSATNEMEEFVCVSKMNLNGHTILYRNELDGILANEYGNRNVISCEDTEQNILEELRKRKMVELKCMYTDINRDFFRKIQSRDVWIQSAFGGVNDIYIGFRTRDGVVNEIKKFSLTEIAHRRKNWNPNEIMNFCESFFSFIKNRLAIKYASLPGDQKTKMIQIYFTGSPYHPLIETALLDNQIDDYIPDWYIQYLSA